MTAQIAIATYQIGYTSKLPIFRDQDRSHDFKMRIIKSIKTQLLAPVETFIVDFYGARSLSMQKCCK